MKKRAVAQQKPKKKGIKPLLSWNYNGDNSGQRILAYLLAESFKLIGNSLLKLQEDFDPLVSKRHEKIHNNVNIQSETKMTDRFPRDRFQWKAGWRRKNRKWRNLDLEHLFCSCRYTRTVRPSILIWLCNLQEFTWSKTDTESSKGRAYRGAAHPKIKKENKERCHNSYWPPFYIAWEKFKDLDVAEETCRKNGQTN